MIDLHCHVLPGLDDGPRGAEESLALLRAAADDGARAVVATPHVSPRYPNSAEAIASALAALDDELRIAPAAPEIRVLPGAEIAMTRVSELSAGELAGLGIGGGPWLLLEPPFGAHATGLNLIVRDLHRQGHRVLLAHPERSEAFRRDPHLLQSLVDAGALTSITAGSFAGRFGSVVERFARWLLDAEMVHNVASDFHDSRSRPPGMAEPLERAGLAPLADWLTCEVPGAILEGREIPPRPAAALSAPAPRRRRPKATPLRWLRRA
jgi:protein-tyrosine phosphatase